MKSGSNQRHSEKQAQLIRTATELFTRFGSRRVTIEEICRKAGVSKMTFYKYFRNKVDLVRTIRDQWVEEGFRKFDEIDAMDIPFPQKVDRMTQWKAAFSASLHAEFIQELVSLEDVEDKIKRRYLTNIKKAQDRGEVRADIDPELLWVVTEQLYELVRTGAWKRVTSDFSRFQKQLRLLIFYGLLTRSES